MTDQPRDLHAAVVAAIHRLECDHEDPSVEQYAEAALTALAEHRDERPAHVCGSCGEPAPYTIILGGRRMPACLRHLNHWRTPAFDYTCPSVCVEQNHPGREHLDWLATFEVPSDVTADELAWHVWGLDTDDCHEIVAGLMRNFHVTRCDTGGQG